MFAKNRHDTQLKANRTLQQKKLLTEKDLNIQVHNLLEVYGLRSLMR